VTTTTLRERTIALAEDVARQVEDDNLVTAEAEIEALLTQTAAVADADVDADFALSYAYLAGLVQPRAFFERAYKLLSLLLGEDENGDSQHADDDADDDAADAAAAAADDDDDDVRSRLLTMRDQLLQSRLADDVPEVEGLVEGAEMTEAFLRAVELAFARFDADGDGALNEAEFSAYFKAVNPENPVVDAAVRAYVAENFEVVGTASGPGLSKLGFVQLYFSQALSDRDEVEKDFRNLQIALT
jgi:hypothetical protein